MAVWYRRGTGALGWCGRAGIVLCMVLCFGLGMNIMLITHRCFGCCWVVLVLVKGLSSFPCSAGCTSGREGRGHSQESGFKLAKGIFHIM